jgi:hypothetical protein
MKGLRRKLTAALKDYESKSVLQTMVRHAMIRTVDAVARA